MVLQNPGRVTLTLLCLVVALGLATFTEANSFLTPGRDHADLTKMIRKRVPQGNDFRLLPVNGAADDPDPKSTKTTTPLTPPTTTPNTTLTNNTTTDSDTTKNATDTKTPVNNSTSTTLDTKTTTNTSTETTTTDTTTTDTKTTAPLTSPTSSQRTDTVVETVTQDQNVPPTSAAQTAAGAKAPGEIPKTTITVIAAIGGSVAFVAIAWTLFRKWKLRPSNNFDERMQPIDWQPAGPDDGGLPGHRRVGSAASHGSFHSAGHSSGPANNGTVLDHDFTAGPATLAPVGGYADLQRGPSPQPSMSELSRGPSLTHGYDPYARAPPMHHGGYDAGYGPRY